MTFAELNLNPNVFKAISACGYQSPTPIQARSIPDILNGKDVVASAQTGTGKTAAFVLPALHRLSETTSTTRSNKPRILILTPTRELATQITQAISKYGKFLRLNTVSLVGGMPYRQQLKGLARPVDIIVATPGRLLDHMNNHRLDLSAIEMLVLDEADRMLDMGFIDDVNIIAKSTPSSRQTLLFSATVDEKLASIVRQLLKNPTRISMTEEKSSPKLIKQELYMVDNIQHKNRLLQHFLDNSSIYKAIIFSATKINADKLAGQLRSQGYEASPLHSDLKQNVRNKTVDLLRRGKIQFLVATDIAARGIDISDITHVINFDLPRFSEDYVHRIGRTGRAGKEGIAISLSLPTDTRHLQKIERYIGHRIPQAVIEGLEPKITSRSTNSTPAGKTGRGRNSYNSQSRSESNFRGRSEGGFRARSEGESRGRSKDGFRARSESKPRGRSEGEFRARSESKPHSRSEGEFRARSESKPHSRSEGEFRARSESKPHSRSEGEFRARSDSKPRSHSEGEFRARNESESRGRSKDGFRARSDSKPRSRSEGGFRARSESESRGRSKDGFRAARSDSKPRSRSEGGFRARSESEPRGHSEGGFRARSENASRSKNTARSYSNERATRRSIRSESTLHPRKEDARSGNAQRRRSSSEGLTRA